MITTVSLNPSIDRTITINGFQYGGLNRAHSIRNDIGGKAVNVALCASHFRLETECIGFMYRENGLVFEQQLAKAGVGFDFVWIDGWVRTNIKLLDDETKSVTEINTPGEKVDEKSYNDLIELVVQHAERSDFLVFTGSIPTGCPEDTYKTLIESVKGMDCKVVLDADGIALKHGLEAKPFLIKPNRTELENAVGHSVSGIEEVQEAAALFVGNGIENVVVSLGGKGAYFTNGKESFYAAALDVPVCSTVGAGDAMVAGMLAGFSGEMDPADAFRYGMASATACVMKEGTQFDIRKETLNLMNVVKIQSV